jgi:uncharacterized membrane protein
MCHIPRSPVAVDTVHPEAHAMSSPAELAKRILRREWDHLTEQERRVVEAILQRVAVSRDIGRALAADRTFGQRLADAIAQFGGSWTFILLFLGFLAVWATVNTRVPHAFDPYPFIFLNLLLSTIAALQAPLILMSQNRQAARDRAQADADYEVNLKAEIEIRNLHDKLDTLREQQWADLVAMQRDQIDKLQRLLDARR